jgi:hypothetical protein
VGIYDSSRTRVAPVFSRLQCLDPSGRQWLQNLLELANSRQLPRPQAGESRLRVAKWWPREAKLAASPDLLKWLLENAEEPANPAAWGRSPEVMANRRRVVDRDAPTLAEALKNLRERRSSSRAWYVLEGPTQPDVFLDTAEAVVVIEGKRTEPGPTTYTAWMRMRHQMLRHLDAAWEHRQGRRVYGLYIVEAEEGSASVEPSRAWHQAVDSTVSEEVLNGSLPHRSSEERALIGQAVLGVTTWQAVCDKFNMPREVLIPEVFDDRAMASTARKRSRRMPRASAEAGTLVEADESQMTVDEVDALERLVDRAERTAE